MLIDYALLLLVSVFSLVIIATKVCCDLLCCLFSPAVTQQLQPKDRACTQDT